MSPDAPGPRSATALLQRRALAAGALLTLQIEATSRCPLRCAHCYNDREVADRLDVATVGRVLEEAARLGCLFVTFTGGEVYARPDFHELVARARGLDFDVRFQTSGWLLDEAAAELLHRLAVSEVHLSLYSDDPAVHDRVTGTSGSHERALRAIRALRGRGVRVVLKTLVTGRNAGAFRGVQALAAGLGCESTMDATVTPCETGACGPCDLRPSDATLREFYGDYAWTQVAATAPPGPRGSVHPLDEAPCLAGATSVFVASDGVVYPCVDLRIPCGDVRRQTLTEIWRASPGLRRVRGLTWRHLPVCARCALRDYCVHCVALSQHEHGDLLAPATENCRHAVIRHDLLRERGLVPASEVELPPPLAAAAAAGRRGGSAVESAEELVAAGAEQGAGLDAR